MKLSTDRTSPSGFIGTRLQNCPAPMHLTLLKANGTVILMVTLSAIGQKPPVAAEA